MKLVKPRKETDSFTKYVMFYVPDSWNQTLVRTCKELGMTKSEIMRQALFSYLKSPEVRDRRLAISGK